MYSYEQRKKAVELYIQNGHQVAAVLRELGYPSSKGSLRLWYKEFEASGELHERSARKPKYSATQRAEATKHYMEHGECASRTCRELGYPSITQLKKWVAEDCPEDVNSPCRNDSSLVNSNQSKKEQAVIDLCTHNGTAQEIANRNGVAESTVFKWKQQLLRKGEATAVARKTPDKIPSMPLSDDPDVLRSEITRLQQETSDLQKEAEELQKQVYRLQLERDVLEKAAEIIKKGQGVSLDTLTNREKAMVIGALKGRYPVKELLPVFHMAKSSYYYQESRLRAPDKYADLRERIRVDFSESGYSYGYRRLYLVLKNSGTVVSEKVVRRIMHEESLVVPLRKRRKYSSYKGEISPAVPNIINRDFHADNPNEKWLTDITEFHIPAGKIYLSPIIDCFDGLPVSWTIGTSPNAELVNSMLDTAIQTLAEDEHPIVHSDRGCHYRWPGWIDRMEKAGLVRSMSKKGCSPDNSACEGFFGRLKNEIFYGRNWWKSASIEEFIERIDHYIHWYAEKRIKVSLGGLSPMEYRRSLGYMI